MTNKKYFKRIALAIAAVAVSAMLVVYIWSTVILNKTYAVPLSEIQLPGGEAAIHEGQRLVRIEHCSDCHGEQLTGGKVSIYTAPNITRIIPTYTNAELKRLLRYGVKKNGRSVYEMPSYMYHQLQQDSMAKMIAYLRTLPLIPQTPDIPEKTRFTFAQRLAIIKGEITPIAEMIKPGPPMHTPHDTTRVSYGKYLAMTLCTSCHGEDLKGFEGFSTNLAIAAAYNKDDFFRLLRTGEALGGRDSIGLMTKIARNNLKYLNDHEIECIYAYLKTKPTQ